MFNNREMFNKREMFNEREMFIKREIFNIKMCKILYKFTHLMQKL